VIEFGAEPAKFRSKGAGVGVIKGKWPAPESELRSFENLALEQEPEPLKFSRLHQLWFKVEIKNRKGQILILELIDTLIPLPLKLYAKYVHKNLLLSICISTAWSVILLILRCFKCFKINKNLWCRNFVEQGCIMLLSCLRSWAGPLWGVRLLASYSAFPFPSLASNQAPAKHQTNNNEMSITYARTRVVWWILVDNHPAVSALNNYCGKLYRFYFVFGRKGLFLIRFV